MQEIIRIINGLGYDAKAEPNSRKDIALRAVQELTIILAVFFLLQHFGILNRLAPDSLADASMSYGMLFVIGMVTSVHCIAMCGGINLSQTLQREASKDISRKMFKNTLMYNMGRVVSYTVIGGVLGAIGGLTGIGGSLQSSSLLQGSLKLFAGIVMIIMGVNMLGIFQGLRGCLKNYPSKPQKIQDAFFCKKLILFLHKMRVPVFHKKLDTSSYPTFSISILSKTMRKVLTDYGETILEKSPNAGGIQLRSAIRQYLARNRGIQVEIGQIVIGSGAEYLYRLIVELLGRSRVYGIESPSYDKIEQIYRAADVDYELLPLSADGIDSGALAATRADVLHTTPYRSFPTGVTATASKRYEYIRWSGYGERFIVESDYGSEFSVSSQPMETLFVLSDFDNVIYLNTFSRTISPSMRIGYMVLPKQLVNQFQDRLGFYSCTVPTFDQLVLTELINNGDFERHINRVRRAKRRELEHET